MQDTGPSSFLPDGEGMFRFSSLEEAAEALAYVNEDYERRVQSSPCARRAVAGAAPVDGPARAEAAPGAYLNDL